MKKLFFFLFVCIISTQFYGQSMVNIIGGDSKKSVAVSDSPTASNFRVFGDFPPSNFIGVADVEIPVYTISLRDFQFPLSLRYHNGMGNKVGAQTGTTGLGWHLNSGGTITLLDSKKRITSDSHGGLEPGENPIKGNDWSSIQRLKGILGGQDATDLVSVLNTEDNSLLGSAFSVNFNGFSGELYFDHNEKPKFRSKEGAYFEVEVKYGEQDNSISIPLFNGKNATVYIYGEVYQFTLKDSNGVVYEFGGADTAIEFSTLGHSPNSIRPTREPLDDFFNSIKTIPTTWHLKRIKFLNGEAINFNYTREQPIYSSQVYSNLREGITSNNGLDRFFKSHYYINEEQATLINPVILATVKTPVETLKYNYTITNNFHRYSGQVYESYRNHVAVNLAPYFKGDDKKNILFYNTSMSQIKEVDFLELTRPIRKLSSIEVLDGTDQLFKIFDFTYTDGINERIKLSEFAVTGYNNGVAGTRLKHRFNYHMPEAFSPDYHSYNVDDYGFYNSKNGYLGYLSDVQNVSLDRRSEILAVFKNNKTARDSYIVNRKPEISRFNTWEILTDIIYPTGGYTKFDYEPNRYGGIARDYPFVVEPYSQADNLAGGVRIKQIRNYDTDHKLTSSKSYAYIKNYVNGSQESSGILTHVPTYFDFVDHGKDYNDKATGANINRFTYSLSYVNWSSRDIYPANRLRGNHITYSEVTEIDDIDKSFTTYKYKNFDNGFHDHVFDAANPIHYATHYEGFLLDENGTEKEIWKKKDVISMELERGQLLSKQVYKSKIISGGIGSKGTLIKEYFYEYNDSPARFDDYIRTINLYDNHVYNPVNNDFPCFFYVASKIYTYTPYLKKTSVIDYPNGSSIGLVNSETTYQYHDKYKNITEKTVKTDGKTYRTTYKYPYDFTGVYVNMTQKNIIAPVIEQQEYLNTLKTSAVKTNYFKFYPDILAWEPPGVELNAVFPNLELKHLFVPSSIETQHRNGAWQKQMDFLEYDDMGNVLSVKNATGLVTNYIYGYNKTLLVWQIENVPYAAISRVLGINAINVFSRAIKPDAVTITTFENKFAQDVTLKGAFISTFLYDPMRGLIYKKSASGMKEYYKYDESGRLKQVEDANNNILMKYDYNYKQN